MKLLALDTASGRCSAALLCGGELRARAADTARDHAGLILPMVDALLAEAGLSLRQLDGIAFGRGPGSFTGVRIAASVTQGLAAGAGLPVLPVSDLRALALQACVLAQPLRGRQALVLGCMDARMGEVYWGVYDNDSGMPGDAVSGEAVGAPDSLILPAGRLVAAAGRGLRAWPTLGSRLGLPGSMCLPEAEPHAADIARLASADLGAGRPWLDPQAAQPVYLRDQVAKVPG